MNDTLLLLVDAIVDVDVDFNSTSSSTTAPSYDEEEDVELSSTKAALLVITVIAATLTGSSFQWVIDRGFFECLHHSCTNSNSNSNSNCRHQCHHANYDNNNNANGVNNNSNSNNNNAIHVVEPGDNESQTSATNKVRVIDVSSRSLTRSFRTLVLAAWMQACHHLRVCWQIMTDHHSASKKNSNAQYYLIVLIASLTSLIHVFGTCALNIVLPPTHPHLESFVGYVLLNWIVMTHSSVMLVSKKLSCTYQQPALAWKRLLWINYAMLPLSFFICFYWFVAHTSSQPGAWTTQAALIGEPLQISLWGVIEFVLSGAFILKMWKYHWTAVERRGILVLAIVGLCDIATVVTNIFLGDLESTCVKGFVYCLRIRLEISVLNAMVESVRKRRFHLSHQQQQLPHHQNNNHDEEEEEEEDDATSPDPLHLHDHHNDVGMIQRYDNDIRIAIQKQLLDSDSDNESFSQVCDYQFTPLNPNNRNDNPTNKDDFLLHHQQQQHQQHVPLVPIRVGIGIPVVVKGGRDNGNDNIDYDDDDDDDDDHEQGQGQTQQPQKPLGTARQFYLVTASPPSSWNNRTNNNNNTNVKHENVVMSSITSPTATPELRPTQQQQQQPASPSFLSNFNNVNCRHNETKMMQLQMQNNHPNNTSTNTNNATTLPPLYPNSISNNNETNTNISYNNTQNIHKSNHNNNNNNNGNSILCNPLRSRQRVQSPISTHQYHQYHLRSSNHNKRHSHSNTKSASSNKNNTSASRVVLLPDHHSHSRLMSSITLSDIDEDAPMDFVADGAGGGGVGSLSASSLPCDHHQQQHNGNGNGNDTEEEEDKPPSVPERVASSADDPLKMEQDESSPSSSSKPSSHKNNTNRNNNNNNKDHQMMGPPNQKHGKKRHHNVLIDRGLPRRSSTSTTSQTSLSAGTREQQQQDQQHVHTKCNEIIGMLQQQQPPQQQQPKASAHNNNNNNNNNNSVKNIQSRTSCSEPDRTTTTTSTTLSKTATATLADRTTPPMKAPLSFQYLKPTTTRENKVATAASNTTTISSSTITNAKQKAIIMDAPTSIATSTAVPLAIHDDGQKQRRKSFESTVSSPTVTGSNNNPPAVPLRVLSELKDSCVFCYKNHDDNRNGNQKYSNNNVPQITRDPDPLLGASERVERGNINNGNINVNQAHRQVSSGSKQSTSTPDSLPVQPVRYESEVMALDLNNDSDDSSDKIEKEDTPEDSVPVRPVRFESEITLDWNNYHEAGVNHNDDDSKHDNNDIENHRRTTHHRSSLMSDTIAATDAVPTRPVRFASDALPNYDSGIDISCGDNDGEDDTYINESIINPPNQRIAVNVGKEFKV